MKHKQTSITHDANISDLPRLVYTQTPPQPHSAPLIVNETLILHPQNADAATGIATRPQVIDLYINDDINERTLLEMRHLPTVLLCLSLMLFGWIAWQIGTPFYLIHYYMLAVCLLPVVLSTVWVLWNWAYQRRRTHPARGQLLAGVLVECERRPRPKHKALRDVYTYKFTSPETLLAVRGRGTQLFAADSPAPPMGIAVLIWYLDDQTHGMV
jgi:hypothetical protein